MAQEFRMESERSIRNRTSKQPRFPLGITSESFGFLRRYCEDYGYPIGHPLCLSVDDTKLFPAMQPLYDGPAKSWFLIGLPGKSRETQLQAATPEQLEKLMDSQHSPATKEPTPKSPIHARCTHAHRSSAPFRMLSSASPTCAALSRCGLLDAELRRRHRVGSVWRQQRQTGHHAQRARERGVHRHLVHLRVQLQPRACMLPVGRVWPQARGLILVVLELGITTPAAPPVNVDAVQHLGERRKVWYSHERMWKEGNGRYAPPATVSASCPAIVVAWYMTANGQRTHSNREKHISGAVSMTSGARTRQAAYRTTSVAASPALLRCRAGASTRNRPRPSRLRLWAIQIPFPNIPPLAFAVLPIASKITASELTTYQLRVMSGLADRQFRFISNVADGAAVELNCQEQVAKAGSSILHNIIPPSNYSKEEIIGIPLYNLQGNIYINTQDAPHGRKTARNNIFSGARGLVLGDFVVHYKQLYDMAMTVSDPTLYERDVVRADRQDDNAAHRVFSAATLKGLTADVEENMGLIVFLFVIGELIDAYESRTMLHAERAMVALRARLFLSTWKVFLNKMGYSIQRHYLPPGTTKILYTLIDGLLGLILIHRDHLPSPTIPLLPWKHESMANERIFSALRGIFPEMSLVQALLAVPNIRATMSKAQQALFSKASYKKVANGYSFSDDAEDSAINFGNLAKFPTDLELTSIYGEAIEENDMLWSILNVQLPTLTTVPAPEAFVALVDTSDNEDDHLAEGDLKLTATNAAIADLGIQDELQEALAAVQNVAGLLKGEEEEIDACAYAAAALVVDGLSKIDDLPTHEDPALLEQSRADVARIIKLTPQGVESLIAGLQTSFGGTSSNSYNIPIPSSPSALLDITSSDLAPLVQIREHHQTEHSRTGVRNYKPNKPGSTQPNDSEDSAGTLRLRLTMQEKKSPEPSDKQLLARRIQTVIRNTEARKVMTGLNRKARTEQSENAALGENIPSGNAANAAASAQVRAVAAVRRRRNVAKTLKCHALVGEAGIGPLAPLEVHNFVFLIDRGDIVLAKILSMYAKGGGKAGAHAFIPQVDSIGPISFVLAQTYEHAGGRTFRRVHAGAAAMLGISRFAHAPAGSVLLRVPDTVTIKPNQLQVELSPATTVKFRELISEKAQLVWFTTVLNTVQRRGAGNVNIINMDADEDADE
ncbi:hypothetical protein GGX14DRAFT_580306 [Mycena pura]|uniref:Uncharacterized protein n=1 Tax=Mycena pura TaxID=153505 RepID=A0AAD6XVX9_9AGAR|nr:hypothetical protein GGX14DRAFT_580306 [Mycena pura]